MSATTTKTSGPLISTYPCSLCDDNKYVHGEPPDNLCAASPTGDFECSLVQELEALEGIAYEVAAILRRISNREHRREVAESTSDGFSNAVYEIDRRAAFSHKSFMAACGLQARATEEAA